MGTVPIPWQEIVLKVARPWPALGGVFLRPAARRRGDVWQVGGSAFYGYDDGRFKDRFRDDDAAHRRDVSSRCRCQRWGTSARRHRTQRLALWTSSIDCQESAATAGWGLGFCARWLDCDVVEVEGMGAVQPRMSAMQLSAQWLVAWWRCVPWRLAAVFPRQ